MKNYKPEELPRSVSRTRVFLKTQSTIRMKQALETEMVGILPAEYLSRFFFFGSMSFAVYSEICRTRQAVKMRERKFLLSKTKEISHVQTSVTSWSLVLVCRWSTLRPCCSPGCGNESIRQGQCMKGDQ